MLAFPFQNSCHSVRTAGTVTFPYFHSWYQNPGLRLFIDFIFHSWFPLWTPIPFHSVIGTPFYLMDYVPGRIFKSPSLFELSAEERGGFYTAMCEVLAAIHSVDIAKGGLQDFGKTGKRKDSMIMLSSVLGENFINAAVVYFTIVFSNWVFNLGKAKKN